MVAITTTNPAHLPARRPAAGRRRLEVVPGPATAPHRVLGLLVAGFVALAVLAAVGFLVASPPATPGTGGAPTLDAHVVVEGETMWSIAQEIAPAGEAATYVERLVAANGGADIAPGAVLTVPAP